MASTDNTTVSTDQQNSTAPNSDVPAFHEHSQSCNDPTHHHNFPTFFDQNDLLSSLKTTNNEVPVKRKGKKNQKQGTIRAELIPGHRGNENIDDLVNFINSSSPANVKNQKKKSTTN